MKKVTVKFGTTETQGLKAILQEVVNGEHDMGDVLNNIVLLELAERLLPKLIFAKEVKLKLANSEAYVLAKLLHDPFDQPSMNSSMARNIAESSKDIYRLLDNYNLTTTE